MKILFYIHGYPPTHNAGAEWMAYDMVEYLKEFHDIRVLTQKPDNTFQDGVAVLLNDPLRLKAEFKAADIVVTHLDFSGKAFNICRLFGKELYAIIHNTNESSLIRRHPSKVNLIYNSHYTETMNYPQRNVLCRPPIVPERYAREKTGENAITLVNCWPDKGGEVLIELARMMPKRKFIGVLGGYGQQIQSVLPNLEYVRNTPDMAAVYARTEILIQPSRYESYGKAACEALACDIPVICTGTPGLMEAMDYAGIYVERTAADYLEAIESMDLDKQIELCRARTAELVAQSRTDLENLNTFISWKN